MGLVSALVGLPLAPVRGVVWIAEVVRRQVEDELYSPAAVRRQLEEVEEARASGCMSADDAERAEAGILDRLTGRNPDTASGAGE